MAMLGETAAACDAPGDPQRTASRLAAGFAALVALAWSLIVLGALVRAHGAGLACPDWPLCFGEFVPSFDLRVGFEWSHRVLAGGVSLGFVALAVGALRHPSTRRSVGRLALFCAALLAVQILLGALTVWQLLASWTVTAHLLVGNAFAATLVWIAATLREQAAGGAGVAPVSTAPRRWLFAAAALLVAQMCLGGLVSSRYAGLACPDWPSCGGGVWFPTWSGPIGLQLLHRWIGAVLLGWLAATAWVCRRQAVAGLTWLALALGGAQVVVGIANVLLRLPVEVTGLHSALAAALVLTLTLALRRAI
jgi:heme A synthase